jgi:hypothetical protein
LFAPGWLTAYHEDLTLPKVDSVQQKKKKKEKSIKSAIRDASGGLAAEKKEIYCACSVMAIKDQVL